MVNARVYPITAGVTNDLIDAGYDPISHKEVRMMLETLGEYEHGSADVPTVFDEVDALWAAAAEAEGELDDDDLERQRSREQLLAYAAVTLDLGLMIVSQS